MRLSKLKLAGFKTFVDPTTVHTPGNLVGIVGPNGCGKSNIIDAVRWVLGETRASALRGESMQDVIFNGSGTRKPVSRASVELVFDNADGRASGQWSQYAEIAVKRVLDRSGDSSYYINNVHVRRKDVVDVFLGTGLGPRAYAIIEQGMISRIIEARPEEIRGFLEEAAGVTKYRERRRETEGRLRDARDNLTRLDDIRSELGERVEHLAVQAEVASRYRSLRDRHVQRQNLLWLLKRETARAEQQRLQSELAETGRRVEADSERLRALEEVVNQGRAAHLEGSEAVNAAQSEFYAASAEVGRLESEQQRLVDLRRRIGGRLTELDAEAEDWRTRQQRLVAEGDRWRELLDNAQARHDEVALRHEHAAQGLPALEDALRAADATVQAVRRELSQSDQQLRVQEAHRNSAQRALAALAERRARLSSPELGEETPHAAEIARAEAELQTLQELVRQREGQLAELQARLPEAQVRLRDCLTTERGAQSAVATLRARADALTQLQAKVANDGKLGPWLSKHGLDALSPLWKRLSVEPGWETALEAVMRERLSALDHGSAGTLVECLQDPAPTTVSLLRETPDLAVNMAAFELPAGGRPMRELVRGKDPQAECLLDHWLAGVVVVERLDQTHLQGGRLATGVRLVARDGQMLDACSLTQYAPDARTHGVMERERDIQQCEAELGGRVAAHDTARSLLEQAESEVAGIQERIGALRNELHGVQQRAHAHQVAVLKLVQARQRAEEHVARLARDLDEVAQAEGREQDHLAGAEAELGRAAELAAVQREQLEAALDVHRRREEELRTARAQEQAISRELQEAGFAERECRGKLADNERNLELAQRQAQRIEKEISDRRAELDGCDDAASVSALQQALALRESRETSLSQCRDRLAEITAALKENDALRLRTEQSVLPLRELVAELRLGAQAAELSIAQYSERLSESGANEDELRPLLGAGLSETGLVREVARLAREIGELGAVNLAALDELSAAQERKGYLDAQNQDLEEAIGTLEDAIRRIDRETRVQLQSTYDFVNRHFGELFPQLFGGGKAELVLTGEEILDAGIQIVAQPPGKKNTSIHLLSGGEKALTAIALVFSMFQLNPAPFCMLDEVDAPLDDTNTGRYGAMVRRMSSKTQFVFITHNKLTMEIAKQLVGVTMQEQGVSRVVEVDIDEALRMADMAVA